MNIIVRNHASIANKYIRFAKWKIRKLQDKFRDMIYSEIYIKKVSEKPQIYKATVKIGVPGPDIVVSASSMNLKELWAEISSKMKRQIRKYASSKT